MQNLKSIKQKKSSFLLKKNKIENEIKIEKKNNFSYSKLGCFTRMVEKFVSRLLKHLIRNHFGIVSLFKLEWLFCTRWVILYHFRFLKLQNKHPLTQSGWLSIDFYLHCINNTTVLLIFNNYHFEKNDFSVPGYIYLEVDFKKHFFNSI